VYRRAEDNKSPRESGPAPSRSQPPREVRGQPRYGGPLSVIGYGNVCLAFV